MAIKLMATDMDGTFLDKKSQYDAERLRKLLAQAKEKGIYFVVASGRAVQSLKEVFADFQDQVIFLGENGTVVEYKGKTLYEEIMPRKLYLDIVDKIRTSHFKNRDMIHLSGKKGAIPYPASMMIIGPSLNITIQASLRWMILPLFRMRFSRLGLILQRMTCFKLANG